MRVLAVRCRTRVFAFMLLFYRALAVFEDVPDVEIVINTSDLGEWVRTRACAYASARPSVHAYHTPQKGG